KLVNKHTRQIMNLDFFEISYWIIKTVRMINAQTLNFSLFNQTKSELMIMFKNDRSEEHTSELQSRVDLVCRLLLEKKKKIQYTYNFSIITIKHRTPTTTLFPYTTLFRS